MSKIVIKLGGQVFAEKGLKELAQDLKHIQNLGHELILVHGGGWNAGDKSGGPKKGYMAPMHEPLQKAGFAWFSINYRLAPKHPYPACVEDVETAIR